jgi:hypothetical protein
MKTLTAKELQAQDPKRFQTEYSNWREYALDYEWWDCVYYNFKEDVREFGVTVADANFSLSYSQSDYAAFEGRIDVQEFMQAKGWDVDYPALYLAVLDCGDYAIVSTPRSRSRVSYDGACIGNTYPAGVFQHLDHGAWDELIEEQFCASGLEDEMQSFVDDMCDTLYKNLRDEYEALISEEAFIDSCECNEVTFEIELEGETNEVCA